MSSNPTPETIIREALPLLPDDPRTLYISESEGMASIAAHAALDALVRERNEARAENERWRIRYGSFLDWAIGFVSSTVEPEDPEAEWFEIRRSWLQRLEGQLWEERAALAAAQEPPAYTPAPECPRCGLFLAPGEVHGEHEVGCVARGPAPRDEIRHLRERLDAQTNVLGWIRDTFPDATDCWGEDVRLDSSECEPPAEGGDR